MESQQVKFSRGEVVVPNDDITMAFRYCSKHDLIEGVSYRHVKDSELAYFLKYVEGQEITQYKDEKDLSKRYNESIKSARKERSSEIGRYSSMQNSFNIFKK